jgi:hypothetical protein
MGLAHVRYGVKYENATWAYIDHVGRPVFRYSDHGVLKGSGRSVSLDGAAAVNR